MVTMIFFVQIFYLYAVYIKMQFSSFFLSAFFFFLQIHIYYKLIEIQVDSACR